MKRLLPLLILITCCFAPKALAAPDSDAVTTALAELDRQIDQAQQEGDEEKEGECRWQKIVTLKNYSQIEAQIGEAEKQMEWFEQHDQSDRYYRSWQLKTNAMCALGKLQMALKETQDMLNDAKEHDSKVGRAMAYKQIGIIYLNMKQTEPAVEALQQYAELMKDEQDDISSLSNIYYRMAKAYDYDMAYEKEMEIVEEWHSFLDGRAQNEADDVMNECYNHCYLAKAAAMIGMKRLDDAALALDTAALHAWQSNTGLNLHHYYKMEARYHLARGNYEKALLYTDSVSMATNENDDHTAEVRAQALIMLGRGTEAALIYQQLYHNKDSVFGRDARLHLDELKTMFQIDELKTEQQHTKIRYMLIAGLSVVLALLALLLLGWRSAIRQKKVNEQLRKANERATVSSKMKTEFIRNISHEIRTPLNIISGFTQVLTEQGVDLPDEEKADAQQRIAENADRITKIVDRMLELSDASSETVIECHDRMTITKIMAHAIDHSRIELHTLPTDSRSKVTFIYNADEASQKVTLMTNERYIVRALAQLLENAVKFTKEGTITLQAQCNKDTVRFIVEDTGIGIPAEQSEHIFAKFVQLNDFSNGTGIGLPVARSIARRLEGDLRLDTTYKHGARFILELPRTQKK